MPYRIPARMKLCTNWRWNSRKATSSGADVISVAAVMIDQSMPWSVDGEHLQADGQRPRADGIGDDQRPEEVVPVVAHRHQPVGDVDGPRQRHIDLAQHLQRPAPSTRAASSSSCGTVRKVCRSRKMPKAEAR